jgi:4-carboxymuconolactone decarboxylase
MARIMVNPGLDLLTREYLLIASCVTLRALPQLRMHVACALKLGGTKQQIVEVIRHMISYAGGRAVADALHLATEVFQADRGNSQHSTLNCQPSSGSALRNMPKSPYASVT